MLSEQIIWKITNMKTFARGRYEGVIMLLQKFTDSGIQWRCGTEGRALWEIGDWRIRGAWVIEVA